MVENTFCREHILHTSGVAFRIYTTTLLLENTFYREHILHTSGVAFRIYTTTLLLTRVRPRKRANVREEWDERHPAPTPYPLGHLRHADFPVRLPLLLLPLPVLARVTRQSILYSSLYQFHPQRAGADTAPPALPSLSRPRLACVQVAVGGADAGGTSAHANRRGRHRVSHDGRPACRSEPPRRRGDGYAPTRAAASFCLPRI
jgi:hypothetical protein